LEFVHDNPLADKVSIQHGGFCVGFIWTGYMRLVGTDCEAEWVIGEYAKSLRESCTLHGKLVDTAQGEVEEQRDDDVHTRNRVF
jgi:hypothetical protein